MFLCDKPRCLKILQEGLNMFSYQPRWRLSNLHEPTLYTWIFSLRPQCTRSHVSSKTFITEGFASLHRHKTWTTGSDQYDIISQQWKWRENVKYPTTVAAVSVLSSEQHSKYWRKLYFKCVCCRWRTTTLHFGYTVDTQKQTNKQTADKIDGTTVTLHSVCGRQSAAQSWF